MANIIRRDPLREVYSMSRALDRMLDRTLNDINGDWDTALQFSLPLDVIEKEKEYVVKANVAGYDPEKIDITYNNNTLTIKGNFQEDKESQEEGQYHLKECRMGSFCRTITMPGQVDTNKIEADVENGILSLRLPKKAEAQPKRIEVKSKSVKVIEGKTK